MALTDSFTCEGDAGVKLLLSVETVMCETCECMSAVVIGFALQTLSAKVASSCSEQLGSTVAKRSCISAGSFCRKRWRTICIQLPTGGPSSRLSISDNRTDGSRSPREPPVRSFFLLFQHRFLPAGLK